MSFKFNPLTGNFDLASDEGGSLGYTPEDVANKSNDSALGTSTTLYPTQNAVKTYVDNAILSGMDEVLEFIDLSSFPAIGETGKIYVALDTNLTYRWSGSTYIQISESSVLSVNTKVGTVVLDKTDIGLGNIDNTSDLDKPISNDTQDALDLKVDKAGDTMTGTLIINPVVGNAIEAGDIIIGEPYGSTVSVIATKNTSGTDSELMFIASGSTQGGSTSGLIIVQSGDSNTGNSGQSVFRSGAAVNSGNSGIVSVHSGNVPVTGNSGVARIFSGNANSGNTGDVYVYSGNSANGNSGNVVVSAGSATGDRGQVVLDGSQITVQSKKITNLADGTNPQDAVTFSQLSQKQNLLAYTPEDVANKSTDILLGTSNILYPTQNAVKTYVDNAMSSGAPDATTTTKGIIQLSGDLSGTADSPTVPGLSILEVELLTKVSKFGDSMVGSYYLTGDIQVNFGSIKILDSNNDPAIPTLDEEVTTKKYVDQELENIPLSSLTQSSASSGQSPVWNGTEWVAANVDSYDVNYTMGDPLVWNNPAYNVEAGLNELAYQVSAINQINTEFYQIFEDMKEPTGFVNRTDSVMTFDNITRKLSLQPAITEYSIYQTGVIAVINFNLEVTIPDISGSYYIYINSVGDLVYSTSFDISLITTNVYCAYIYWSSSDQAAVVFGDERHGITMDGSTHGYLHTTRGTQLVSGASIGYTIGGDTISLSDMQIKDEDITVNINNNPSPSLPFQQILSPAAQIPIIYREGASEWRKWTATTHPMLLQPGDVRASYNENVGGIWQLTEAPSNNKVLVSYIFATPSIEEPVMALLGQNQYNNIDEARGSASWDQISFGDLPSPEMKLLYTIYYETSSGFASAVKSQISHISDLRFTHDREVSATIFNSDHANLSGLAIGDDHPQYLNQTRGDARYYTKTESDSNFETKLISGTNIKTINGSSILGSGDLSVSAVISYSANPISTLDIDWSLSEIFYKDISISSTFTFSNLVEGKGIAVILTNTSASSITITFPSGIFKEAGSLTIAANSAAVYSFLRANSKTYLASITDLSNA